MTESKDFHAFDPIAANPPGAVRHADSAALPHVWLVPDGDAVLVAPAGTPTGGDRQAAASTAFDPFPLPPVRKSLADWLAVLGEDFRRAHGRCLAAVLLLDVPARSWAAAVPAQRAGRDASCWSARAADLPAGAAPPGVALAGSFQVRVLAAGEDPADAPPPHDGVHLVYAVPGARPASSAAAGDGGDPPPPAIHVFLRVGGRTRAVPPERALVDDAAAALAEAAPRVRLV